MDSFIRMNTRVNICLIKSKTKSTKSKIPKTLKKKIDKLKFQKPLNAINKLFIMSSFKEVLAQPTTSNTIPGRFLCDLDWELKESNDNDESEHLRNRRVCLICKKQYLYLLPSSEYDAKYKDSMHLKDKLSRLLAIDESCVSKSESKIDICFSCKDEKIKPILDTFARFDEIRDKLICLSTEICEAIITNHDELHKGHNISVPAKVRSVANFHEFNLRRINTMLTRGISLNAGASIELNKSDETEPYQANPTIKLHNFEPMQVKGSFLETNLEEMDSNASFNETDHSGIALPQIDAFPSPAAKVIDPENKKYDCSVCGRKFKLNRSLTRHLRIHVVEKAAVNPISIYNCILCNETFSDQSIFEVHKKQHKTEKNFCPICEKEISPGALVDHLLSHQNKDVSFGIVNCSICTRTFESPLLLAYHMDVHKGQLFCKETWCKKGFASSEELVQHQLLHETSVEILGCDFCCEVFDVDAKEKYEEHVSMHKQTFTKRYLCESCGKYFPTKLTLNRHIRSAHTDVSFNCEVCNKVFSTKSNLNCHQRVHQGLGPFSCPECDLQFFQKVSLDNHMRKHNGTGSMPYQCEHCDHSGFSYAKGLRQHMFNTHPNIYLQSKKFACTVCYKNFEVEAQLEQHSLTHENLKCKICTRQFKMRNHLNEHLLRHASIKPYKCNHCSKNFIRRNLLSNHIKKSHPHENSSPEINVVTYMIAVE